MFLFEPHCRIQEESNGIRFYEQDILRSTYTFTGDQKIEINLDYVTPGFGISISEIGENTPGNPKNTYLIKFGSNDFRVIQQYYGTQKELLAESCVFPFEKNVVISFKISQKNVSIHKKLWNKDGLPYESLIADFDIAKPLPEYNIGIYSNAGNLIRSIVFLSKIPEHWRVSTKNTMGGRISLEKNSFRIENCEHEAEIEQKDISLKKGEYWLKYDFEKVRDKCDIRPLVLNPVFSPSAGEANLEDDFKNILEEDMSFTLSHDMLVNLKFKGHNGIIRNIAITDSKQGSFVETKESQKTQEGSEIIIKLKNIKQVLWEALINEVPQWEDLTKECPYAIIESSGKRYSAQELSILMNKEYVYTYNVLTKQLDIVDKLTKQVVFNKTINDPGEIITITKNVTGIVYKILLTDMNGTIINPLIRTTFKKYISTAITSPVIVTSKDSDEPFDLSASYREVVIPRKRISLYSKEHPLILKDKAPITANEIKIYGIPRGSIIDTTATTIDKFSSSYDIIDGNDYERKGSYVIMPEKIRKKYEYLAIEQTSIDDYTYEFTNYERESFKGTTAVLHLEHEIAKKTEDIVLYGIPKDSDTREKYFYRVPTVGSISSIDYYTDNYDIIMPSKYIVDSQAKEIVLNDDIVDGRYKEFIVDYLKQDSYAINKRDGQYEIDISTEANVARLHYDMHEDGSVYDYIYTDIESTKDKYVIIKRKGG